MNIQAASGESRAMGSRPLAAWDTLMDTIAMINTPSVTKTGQRSYDMCRRSSLAAAAALVCSAAPNSVVAGWRGHDDLYHKQLYLEAIGERSGPPF
mgnify:CR=1 FL=1